MLLAKGQCLAVSIDLVRQNTFRITAIAFPNSGYGKYGRHNREYNKHELAQMLTLCGFEIEVMFSANVHQEYAVNYYNVEKIAELLTAIPYRELDLGQYIFIRAKKVRDVDSVVAPEWLYRSMVINVIMRGEQSKS